MPWKGGTLERIKADEMEAILRRESSAEVRETLEWLGKGPNPWGHAVRKNGLFIGALPFAHTGPTGTVHQGEIRTYFYLSIGMGREKAEYVQQESDGHFVASLGNPTWWSSLPELFLAVGRAGAKLGEIPAKEE